MVHSTRVRPAINYSVMMKKILVLMLSLVNLTIALGQSPAQPSVTMPAPLARVLTDYEKAWSQKDAAALAQLFAEDGFVLPSGAPMVRGRDAIKRAYTGAGGPLFLRAVAFATEGNISRFLAAYGGGLVTVPVLPSRFNYKGDGLRQGNYNYAFNFPVAIFREFWPDVSSKFHHH